LQANLENDINRFFNQIPDPISKIGF